jgi:hypothetical protein
VLSPVDCTIISTGQHYTVHRKLSGRFVYYLNVKGLTSVSTIRLRINKLKLKTEKDESECPRGAP